MVINNKCWFLTAPKNSCSFIFCDNSYWSQVTSISSYKLNIFRNRTCRTCICHIPGILQYVYMTNMRHELFREGYLLLAFLKRVHILANLSMILVFHFLWVTPSTVVFQPTLIQNHFLTLIEFFTVSDLSNLIHYICDTFR